MSAGWEDRAQQWLAWARTPEFDGYWGYRDAFFALVPPPGRRTLEIGCGEGRVSRDLTARGHRVTALDASPTLLDAARERDSAAEYVLAAAEALPFPDASFDLAVIYNVLMDVADMPAAVAEAARVLTPGGCLCACVTHPFADAGRWADVDDPDSPFLVEGSYLEARRFDLPMERGGLTMRFDGMAYPLEDYARAVEAGGLVIEALREPPATGTLGHRPEGESWRRWRRIPNFLMWRARRPAAG
jgi:SAM-dependent methyltransferase